MAFKFEELRKLPISKLYELHDKEAEHVQASLNYYLGEIIRREQSKQTRLLIWLNILVVIATVFSAIGVFVK